MKLMFCDKCYDVFKLAVGKLRTCECGKVKAMYENNVDAVSNGRGYCMAIGNGSLMQAIRMMATLLSINPESSRDAFISEASITFAWVRPHCGEGNPHMKVKENLC